MVAASYGYLAFLIRAAPPYRGRELQRLSAMGETNVDLMSEVSDAFAAMGEDFHHNASKTGGHRLKESKPLGRSLFLRLNQGPVGSPGETFDVESLTSNPTSEKIALLSQLRAAVFIPKDSYYGFLFVERIGNRHLKELLYTRVFAEIAKRRSMLIRLEPFAETEDWARELAGQRVLRVSEVFNPKKSENDASTVDDQFIRVSAEGGIASDVSERIKARLLDVSDRKHETYRVLKELAPFESRRKILKEVQRQDGSTVERRVNAPATIFTVDDADQLTALAIELEALKQGAGVGDILDDLRHALPVDRERLDSRRVEVALGVDQPKRSILIEGESLPQLVYELGGRLVDSELRRLWESEAERFFAALKVTLPDGWLSTTE